MGRERQDQVDDRFIGLKEASVMLELPEKEVKRLIQAKKLTAYQLGSQVIRLKKDDVWNFLSESRITQELFPDERAERPNIPVIVKWTAGDRVRDFFYFNDFYIISALAVTALLYLILAS